MPSKEFEYTTLSEGDKLALLLDSLRGRESDHYRLSRLSETEGATPQRIAEIEETIASLRSNIVPQKKKAEAEQRAIEKAAKK